MHSITLTSVLATTILTLAVAQTNTVPVTGLLGNATVVKDNPVGVTYIAVLPTKEFFNPEDPRGNIKGSVSGTANPNGVGVSFHVTFSNLPTSGGPFLYHLHEAPVPSDGNCTATLGHVDPFERGESPPCDPTLPQTCQVGDLAGKYGAITSDPFTASYTDDYASTLVSSKSFFGNGALTLHFANTTRITCANWTLVTNTSPSGGNISSNATASSPPPQTPVPTAFGASSKTVVPTVSLFVVVALALIL